MIVLDTTSKSITVAMSAAATTTNPSFVTAYSDDNGTTFVEGSSDGALNGTTQVTMVASPASSTRRLIKTIYVENGDTAPVTITVTLNNSGTLRTIAKVTLQVGDTWSTDGTTDTNGNLKTIIGSVNLSSVTGILSGTNGGTGVNNGSNTITLAGNLTTSGANALTLTTTGATNVTLPTSGTLSTIALSGTNTWTGSQTFSGSTSVFGAVTANIAETTNVISAAPSSTQAIYTNNGAVQYFTSNAANNWTINLAFSSGTSMNTALSTGQSVTMAVLTTQGSTAYYNTAVQVDGTTSGVTTKWQGGAPTSGNASGIDVYTYTITKTASATYTVLASLTQFK
jgi:hypothetical protein